jgi:hypothetical protein
MAKKKSVEELDANVSQEAPQQADQPEQKKEKAPKDSASSAKRYQEKRDKHNAIHGLKTSKKDADKQ